MKYHVIGDSLVNNYDYPIVDSFSGMTLEQFMLLLDLYPIDEIYVFCFGINDLMAGTLEQHVIDNYKILSEKYTNCFIVMPPFQSQSFYDRCINQINQLNVTIVLTFISEYKSIDGLHPTGNMLHELKNDIE